MPTRWPAPARSAGPSDDLMQTVAAATCSCLHEPAPTVAALREISTAATTG